jgi:hypothetical protein
MIMQRSTALLAIGFAFLVGIDTAHAAPVTYTATLAGANENPPNASPGIGSATVIIDTAAHTLRVVSNFSGLTSNTTASHIHCCAVPPANAGVATTTPSFVGFPLGVTSGSMDQTYDTTLAGSWNPAFITSHGGTPATAEAALAAGLAAGQAYLNIHTANFPGGELRGNLVLQAVLSPLATPTLSDWVMVLLALLLAASAWLVLRKRTL